MTCILTCAKQDYRDLDSLASTVCSYHPYRATLRLAAVQVPSYIYYSLPKPSIRLPASPWLTHSLDNIELQHRQPSGRLQLRRNVTSPCSCVAMPSASTASLNLPRARSRWLELKLVTPASLRHGLLETGQEGRRDGSVETASSLPCRPLHLTCISIPVCARRLGMLCMHGDVTLEQYQQQEDTMQRDMSLVS